MRTQFGLAGVALLGVTLLVGCQTGNDANTDENALGQDTTSIGPDGKPLPPPTGPCLKVCLTGLLPVPSAGSAPGAEAAPGDDKASSGSAPSCDASDADCMPPLPPPPPVSQCVTFCPPAPGCQLTCDPFAAQGPVPMPKPLPPPPSSDTADQAPPPASTEIAPIPLFPACSWSCPPPPPPPGKKCGPWPGGECLKGEVCNIQSCLPGAGGTCVVQPMGCPDVFMPVCGCDGSTYGTDCDRLMAGVALAHDGECKQPPPPPLPVKCNLASMGPMMCPMGQVCDVIGCGLLEGICLPKPGACPENYAPVCGCDGKTYGNNCERLAAGVPLHHQGECKQPPVPCCGSICPDPSKPCPAVCDPSADCSK